MKNARLESLDAEICEVFLKFDKILTGRQRARSRQRWALLAALALLLQIDTQPGLLVLQEPTRDLRASFSAGSTPIFASKYAFCSLEEKT